MTEDKFPNFPKWAYTKWYFWVIVILYSIWTEFESYVNFYIPEILGSLIACFLIVSLVFLFIYLTAKAIVKHNKIN